MPPAPHTLPMYVSFPLRMMSLRALQNIFHSQFASTSAESRMNPLPQSCSLHSWGLPFMKKQARTLWCHNSLKAFKTVNIRHKKHKITMGATKRKGAWLDFSSIFKSNLCKYLNLTWYLCLAINCADWERNSTTSQSVVLQCSCANIGQADRSRERDKLIRLMLLFYCPVTGWGQE